MQICCSRSKVNGFQSGRFSYWRPLHGRGYPLFTLGFLYEVTFSFLRVTEGTECLESMWRRPLVGVDFQTPAAQCVRDQRLLTVIRVGFRV